MPTITSRVLASGDDVNVWGGGGSPSFSTTETFLRILAFSSFQYTGMRFTNITIPQGAIITAATLSIVADSHTSGANSTAVNVFGVAQDNAAGFSTSGDFSGRPLTTANVAWTPENSWTTGNTYVTPDISSVIQEIVNRSGWASGNALVLETRLDPSNSSNRYAVAYDGTPANAPLLTITYVIPTAPTVTTQAASSIAQTSATGNGNVTDDGGVSITERGIVWSASANPTTGSNLGKQIVSGTTGAFSGAMSGLSPNTTYHYRAYATNSQGTSYGSDTTFTTVLPQAIGYVDTRISYTPKSKYSWFVYLNGQLFCDLTGIAENRSFSQTRNDSDQINFTVSIDKMNDLASRLHVNIADILQAAVSEIRAQRGNVPLVAGELGPWNGNVGGDRKIPLTAPGWFDLLKQRRTSDSFAGSNSGLSITQTLIAETLAKPYGNAGSYAGFVLNTIPTVDQTTIYTDKAYDQKTLYDAIREFTNEVNGFDTEVTWDKKMNIYYPHIGSPRPDITFTYPGNVKDIQYSVDPTKMFNSVTARGKGAGINQLEVSLLASDAIRGKYGLRENVLDYSNVDDTTLLTNIAQADLNVYQNPLVIQKILFDGSGRTGAPQIGTFHIGDLVKIFMNNFGLYPDINQYYIIDKIEVTIGDKDEEDVTITVANPNLPANGS